MDISFLGDRLDVLQGMDRLKKVAVFVAPVTDIGDKVSKNLPDSRMTAEGRGIFCASASGTRRSGGYSAKVVTSSHCNRLVIVGMRKLLVSSSSLNFSRPLAGIVNSDT